LGGSLTHGSDYISASVLWDEQKEKQRIANLNEAYIFKDLVQPILENKCGGCHNESKNKGKLSVASFESLLKGGKNGAAVKPGNTADSELIKRISLNPKNKKFMPTEGKPPLSSAEAAVIKWWIEKAAHNQDQKLTVANPPEDVLNFASAWFGIEANDAYQNNEVGHIRAAPVEKRVLERLTQTGFVIKFLNYKPDLLDVTLPVHKKDNVTDKLKALLAVKDNILWLNVSGTDASDDDLDIINQFQNLERLRLDRNGITDRGIAKLQDLNSIQSLNIYGTSVTKDCLPLLRKMPRLRTAYTGETKIVRKDISASDTTFKIVGAR
jgi:hypothetical protein